MSQRMLFASCLAIVMIGRLEYKPIHDTDIFWQIKLGQIMLREGRIPIEDRFTYTHPGAPVPPIGWLAQALFASLYGLGGWRLTRLVHHSALIGALVTAAANCPRRLATPFSAAVAMTIAFLVMLSNADLRPQSLALMSFAALLAVARSDLSFPMKLAIATPVLVVWQNMHPSAVVGAMALAGLSAADFLEGGRHPAGCWQMVVLTLLAAFAQFVTPLGVGVLAVARNNLRISRDVLHLAEWGPPWDAKVLAAVSPYWIALVGSLIALAWLWGQIPQRDRALFIMMTILSLYASRFIIFWAVALVPFWVQVVESVIPTGMFAWARGDEDKWVSARRSTFGLLTLTAAVFGLVSLRLPPIVEPEIPLDGVRAPAPRSRPKRGFTTPTSGLAPSFWKGLPAGGSRSTAGSISFPIRLNGDRSPMPHRAEFPSTSSNAPFAQTRFSCTPPRRNRSSRQCRRALAGASVFLDQRAWHSFATSEQRAVGGRTLRFSFSARSRRRDESFCLALVAPSAFI